MFHCFLIVKLSLATLWLTAHRSKFIRLTAQGHLGAGSTRCNALGSAFSSRQEQGCGCVPDSGQVGPQDWSTQWLLWVPLVSFARGSSGIIWGIIIGGEQDGVSRN